MNRYLIFLILLSTATLQSYAQREIEDEWVAFYQLIDIDAEKYTNFRLTGAVKVNLTGQQKGSAALWARIDNEDNSTGFFDNMGDRLITSSEWKLYGIEGEINKEADVLNFGGLVEYSGTFFFDQLSLELQDKSGAWEKVELNDGGFEASIENNKMKYWMEGISIYQEIRTMNYSIASSSDAYDGNKSLVIKRK